MEGKFVSYLRVSTGRQGANGLCIEAQRMAIEGHLNGGNWTLLKEFVEVEFGKRDDNRPMLHEALDVCKRTGAKLLIAKLDRLSRNLVFIANLMESGVEFIAVDFPQANRLTVHTLSAMAEYEREMISKRTKAALQAAKARGVKLGSPGGISAETMKKGQANSRIVRGRKADEYARRMYKVIRAFRAEGISLNAIAKRLTVGGELTPRGKTNWTATTVRNVIKRVDGSKLCSRNGDPEGRCIERLKHISGS